MSDTVPIYQWSAEHVAAYITNHLFPETNNTIQAKQYYQAFVDNEIDGSLLLSLTSEEMKQDLSIQSLGHRKRIMSLIEELRDKGGAASSNTKEKKRKQIETITEDHTQEFIDEETTEPLKKRVKFHESPVPMNESQERRDFEFAQSLAPRQCVICLNEVDLDFIHRLSCGHDQFCRSCIKDYLIDQLQSRAIPLKCLIPECKHDISRDELELLLEKKYIDLFEQFSVESVIVKNPRAFANCLTPGCDYVFLYNRDMDHPDFLCPKCGKRYCMKCKVEYHAQYTCDEYQAWVVENGTADDLFDDYVEQSSGKYCPSCNSFVERIDGCNHMTCRCGTYFCYECGEKACEIH